MMNKTKRSLLDVTNAPNNDNGRVLVKVTHEYEDGHCKEWSLNDNVLRYADSDGVWFKRVYDELDRLIEVYSSNGNYKRYTYNSKNTIISVERNTGKWMIQKWNDDGHLIYEESHSGYWVKYVYDTQGQLVFRQTSLGDPETDRIVVIEGEQYKLVKV